MNTSIRFLKVVNGKAWSETDSETKKFNLNLAPPEPLREAVDVIAEDLGIDFPRGSGDYTAKAYKTFLTKNFDAYHKYFQNLQKNHDQ